MHIKLTCSKCKEQLTSVAEFDFEGAIEFMIDPCTSFECENAEEEDLYPELMPLVMPYATLMRILGKKEVVVTYRKKNGSLRELTGHLGQSDGRAACDNLVYFHELVAGTGSATQVKCLLVDHILSVVKYEDGIHTAYAVMEAQ
jgi:hypothetical protein